MLLLAPSLIQRTPLRLLFDGFRAWSYHPKNNFQAQKVTGVSPPLPPAHFWSVLQGAGCYSGTLLSIPSMRRNCNGKGICSLHSCYRSFRRNGFMALGERTTRTTILLDYYYACEFAAVGIRPACCSLAGSNRCTCAIEPGAKALWQ